MEGKCWLQLLALDLAKYLLYWREAWQEAEAWQVASGRGIERVCVFSSIKFIEGGIFCPKYQAMYSSLQPSRKMRSYIW